MIEFLGFELPEGYMENLSTHQRRFTWMVHLLVGYAYNHGYELTYDDTFAKTGHSENSFHYKRLAVDFNLFKDGVYLTETKNHKPLGEYWESIGGTWGGRFGKLDGNHYSYLE